MKRKVKVIPRSPKPNEKSAGLPFCSFIKADGKQCRARAIGHAGLERNGLLEHEHAGEWCLAHLVGPHELARRGGLQKAARWRIRKEAEKLVAETPAVEQVPPALRAQSGAVQVEIDADTAAVQAETEPTVYTQDIRTVAWHSYFDHLTHDQRLRAISTRGTS